MYTTPRCELGEAVASDQLPVNRKMGRRERKPKKNMEVVRKRGERLSLRPFLVKIT